MSQCCSGFFLRWGWEVSSYFTIGTGDTNQFLRDEWQLTDTIRWTKGRHEMSFGGEYARGYGRVINDYRADGTFNFNGGSAPFTGESFADFLGGSFTIFSRARVNTGIPISIGSACSRRMPGECCPTLPSI